MQKAIIPIVMATLCLNFSAKAQEPIHKSTQQKHVIVGKVISSSNNESLSGVVVKISPVNQTTVTNNQGEFTINLAKGRYSLAVYYLSHKARKIEILVPLKEKLLIKLDTEEQNLKEVEIVSTGYQTLPKERATGSFTLIDNKLLNRTVSPDLLSRLKGVTNGLLFDGQTGNTTGISVRGRSTIFSDTTPLIVVDNFPFDGDLRTLNPNDIENVTVLKDAAAASIWGVRAGNGVLVITTKKGKLNQKPSVSFNSNITIGGKPDLYYQPQLSSSEFIDVEKFLFDKGRYNYPIGIGYKAISPVVQILQQQKLNLLTEAQAKVQIDRLRGLDIRDQVSKYYDRNSIQQQYHIDLSGGSPAQTYFFSAGYDKDLPNSVSASSDRITIKGNNTYHLLSDKLKVSADFTFSLSKDKNTSLNGYSPSLPYEQIADQNGNPLAVQLNGGLSSKYTDTAGGGRLLDWKFRPLDELRNGYTISKSNSRDYRLNVELDYKIIESLAASANYQYYNSSAERPITYSQESFYTRNMINSYSHMDQATGVLSRPIPVGDIYQPSFSGNEANYGRLGLNFNQTFAGLHAISAIAGYEARAETSNFNSVTLYGYNPKTASNTDVDYVTQFPFYYGYDIAKIGKSTFQQGAVDRYISYYANLSYTYNDRYILSGSYRKDESNLFGVKANQKGVPLWSAGLAWNVHQEKFFPADWLSSLQFKATYGYNGNVNKSVSAYLTASPGYYTNAYDVNFSNIINPPNDALRWERVQNINLGTYFSTKNNRVSGSIEYYIKRGKDLIGTSPIAPQTGVSLFTGNTADTRSNGVDVQINTLNINRQLKWNTTFILNYVKDRITDYKTDPGANATIVTPLIGALTPVKDYPINAVFAYKWAGLDHTGDPIGFIGGEKSKDYTAILNSNNIHDLQFFGSAMPTFFGGFRNAVSYKFIELSFNISYKLGYYFRKPSVNYLYLYGGNFKMDDYAQRWQRPGDELFTSIPAQNYPEDGNREDFYKSAAVLVQKGDQVRLQDVQLNFNFNQSVYKGLPFSNLNIYVYANNLGILWKANRVGIDPDFISGYPTPRTISLGLKADF